MGTPRTVIVGAGQAGAKAAQTLREEGYDGRIVLLGAECERPYERPPLSKEYLRGEAGQEKVFVHDENFYGDHAIELRVGETVESIDPIASVVLLAGRERLPYDRLLLATGARPRRLNLPGAELDGVCELRTLADAAPRDEIAHRAGVETADGLLVDEYLETSAHNVFAAGDVARAYHPLLERSLRVEHWANALNQGAAAARNMLGAQVAYERLPYFYSDQYDVGMEYTGHAARWDDVAIRGDPDGREFIAFWLRERHVLAAMNVNVWDMGPDIQALIRDGGAAPVDRGRLADTSVPLADLLPAAARDA